MEKISVVFPLTFEILGAGREKLTREFVETCPPFDIDRLKNARQFFDFLTARWTREALELPYLPDVAACELEFATARKASIGQVSARQTLPALPSRPEVRRAPGVALLRAHYDIRPLFEGSSIAKTPPARDVPLVIVARMTHPDIFELTPELFDLLVSLNDWEDRSLFGACEDAEQLMVELAGVGLIEMRS
jgi:hypothetical protein